MTRRDDATIATPTAEVLAAPSVFDDDLPLPTMIVFDLDYTIWPFFVDSHVSGPLQGSSDGGVTVTDAEGENHGFYGDVPGILSAIKSRGIVVGAASRTSAPKLAHSMLMHLRVETGESNAQAVHLFDHLEMYPGSKMTHFQRLQKKSGVEYEEMLFFDDEGRNRNVETLGVVMHLVRNGVTRSELENGVQSWRKRNDRMGGKN